MTETITSFNRMRNCGIVQPGEVENSKLNLSFMQLDVEMLFISDL